MRLNLGCGSRKMEGWVNVDASPTCSPDLIVDLERLPWPFETDSVTEILLSHVLEHLGQAPAVFLGILRELYRVCRSGARVTITVPHPRHDSFLVDPTHVRPILPDTLSMLSRRRNADWKARGVANTPLGVMLDVDFELVETEWRLDAAWEAQVRSGRTTREEALEASRLYANVVQEIHMVIRAIKPARA